MRFVALDWENGFEEKYIKPNQTASLFSGLLAILNIRQACNLLPRDQMKLRFLGIFHSHDIKLILLARLE